MTPIECPIPTADRQWLERRAAWLNDMFGQDRTVRAPVILPTEEFFPDEFNGSEADARVLLDSVCRYLDVATSSVDLRFFDNRSPVQQGEFQQGAAGVYEQGFEKHTIWIEAANLDDPLALVATMARELGHVLLLGERRIDPTTEDHEPLTDLLTVFLGLGVITANAVLREKYLMEGQTSSWSMSRRGYLTMAAYGHAHALYARCRGERDPSWAKALRPDVRDAFVKSMTYLDEQGDNPFPQDKHSGPTTIPLGLFPVDEAEDNLEDEVEEGAVVCTSCGVKMPGSSFTQVQGYCQECQQSIHENEAELQKDYEKYLAQRPKIRMMWLVGFGLLFLFILMLLLFDRK